MKKKGAVLVIGGGIAGIQASLDLADQNFKVYLVERTPSIGGHMAQLDKTLPTNDCSICIEAPKMVEVARHPNIKLLSYSEVVNVEGSVGNFKVRVLKKPRYVDEEKCNGCGECVAACPYIKHLQEFEVGLKLRGNIYIPFPQASPLVYTIDREHCFACGNCKVICEPDAIDLYQKPEEIELDVGTIIVATGYSELVPDKGTYGYGVYKNVVTALQYERLTNAAGPTGGHIVRPSDGKEPKKVAWIQCVGSRTNERPYCSRVCCMYATKEAIITKEHTPDIETYIFYMDMRAYGKGFEEYYKRAEEQIGVKYVRGRPSKVSENSETGDLTIRYENLDTGEVGELEANMLVLACAGVPTDTNKELAKILGVKLDENGFFQEKNLPLAPIETDAEGIYLAGCAQGPKDIPDSVTQASGAAAKAIMPIVEARGEEIEEVELPEEKEVKPTDEPRIGVFVCRCGVNIGRTVNVPAVVEYAKTLPNVVFVNEDIFTCSDDCRGRIKAAIEKNDLNRVVVAACTPRTHEGLFRDTCREVGLNPYLFELVNIRDQCSWVHMNEPEEATKKAKDLLRMGVARARLLESEEEGELSVGPDCLVIGGGIAGMTAALVLADMGFKIKLVEREQELGGMLQNLCKLFPTDTLAKDVIAPKIRAVYEHKNIEIYTGAEIKDIKGYIGNFEVTISKKDSEDVFNVSTIIVATGSQEIDATGYYGYGEYDNVVTQLQLERMLKEGTLKELKNVVIINCVGAREEEGRTYCCRFGCGTSIKNAKYIKEMHPDANVFILHRDIRTVGKKGEEYYNDVRANGVKFIRFSKDKKPLVFEEGEKLIVRVYDGLLRTDLEIEPDLVVLTTATEGAKGAGALQKMLKVPIGAGNFFHEAHVKLRPLDFATDGIYLCGCAHSPKGVVDTITQAVGAASRASIPMGVGMIKSEGITAVINPEACVNCGICMTMCPYGAIRMVDGVTEVITAVCKGCGTCVAACPTGALEQRHYQNKQITSQIKNVCRLVVE